MDIKRNVRLRLTALAGAALVVACGGGGGGGAQGKKPARKFHKRPPKGPAP